jgi:hypothetical protein
MTVDVSSEILSIDGSTSSSTIKLEGVSSSRSGRKWTTEPGNRSGDGGEGEAADAEEVGDRLPAP